MPDRPSFNSPAEAQAFFSSAEWKARMKEQKSFGVAVNADGSFVVDSVPPGTYSLNLTASRPGSQPWESKPVASRAMTLTVPDNANPQSPIEMGEISLPPVRTP